MESPAYGTVQPEDVPERVSAGGGLSRYLAGTAASRAFREREDFCIVDCELPAGTTHELELPEGFETVLVYAYQGEGTVAGVRLEVGSTAVLGVAGRAEGGGGGGGVVRMAAASPDGFGAMVFAGKPIGEPIAWRGPLVMNTDAEIQQAYAELRSGRGFYRERAAGDYRRAADDSDVPYTSPRVGAAARKGGGAAEPQIAAAASARSTSQT